MIIREFLAWTQDASASRRAEATGALARAYLSGCLPADAAWEAKTALLAVLDDPSPLVRRALAETCAASARAPRPLIVALACDVPEVARPVLAQSPLLTDGDLIDAAALGDDGLRALIARRPNLSHGVAGALAEIGDADTLVALAENPTARLTAGRMMRMVERTGAHAPLREALLARTDLPPEVRHAVALAVAQALTAFVTERGWLGQERCERMSREAGERVALDLCEGSGPAAVARLVRHLRATHQLTAGLILRAVLSGRSDFARAAFADLTGLEPAAVARAMADPRGVEGLHRRAGLPEAILPAMRAALAAWREAAPGRGGAGLSRRVIERALAACAELPAHEVRGVTVLLTRYEMEAARDEAREAARAILAEAAAREAARREALAAQTRQAVPEVRAEPQVVPSAVPSALPTIESLIAVVEAAPRIAAETVPAAPRAEPAEVAAGVARPGAEAPSAGEPFNPVGEILDALPGQILERFRAERADAAAQAQRAAAQAVLDGLDAGLLAQYRAGRPVPARPAENLPIAA